LLSAAALLLAGCEFDKITVSKTVPTIVVHAVLNTSAPNQVVLVERTLTGTITVADTGFNALDPIVSAGGDPVRGATVEILDSAGLAVAGVEDAAARADHRGAGVYRVPIGGATLHPGARYELRIRADSQTVTAFTRIPAPDVTSSGGLTRAFNRDHDTLNVTWRGTSTARAYAVRIESPFSPFFLFTDSTHVRITGDLRDLFASDFERVLIPGFRQDILVAAVDSNFYDYYRTGNDPFTGSGVISRVENGLGLFGSLVPLSSGTLTVTADQTEPIEGRFRLQTSSGDPSPPATQFTLYVESKAAKAGLADALSGRFNTSNPSPRTDGVLGTQLGSAVTLALLNNQRAGDTLDVFVGTLQGTTLTGTYRTHGGTATFVKQ
jgi:hypothetical protein